MAIGRISGSVLKSNLTRNGVDLAFETNLLYLDVTNSRVGIGISEPTTALQVNGTITATTLAGTSIAGGTVTDNLKLNDSIELRLGTDADTNIKHTGTNLNINETTGDINIRTYADNKDVVIGSDDGSGGLADYLRADGSTGELKLYYYGSEKLKTINTGVQTTGTISVNGAYTLPTADGSANQVLQTDGSGSISFGTVSIDSLATGGITIDDNKITGQRSNENIEIGASGSGIIETSSSILPATDNAVDLGSSSKRFKDIYASSGTIHVGDQTIKSTASGFVFSGALSSTASTTISDDTTASLVQKTGIGSTEEKTIESNSTSQFDSALYYITSRDEINDQVAVQKVSVIHNNSNGYASTSHVTKTGTTTGQTFNGDVSGGSVRLRATGHSASNSVTAYSIQLGDNSSVGTSGNTAIVINSDVDSSSESLDTWAHASYRGAKYFISVNDEVDDELESIECLVVHDGTTAYITDYNSVRTGSNSLITLTATLGGSNVTLSGSGARANLNVKMHRILLSDSEAGFEATNQKIIPATTVSSTATTIDQFDASAIHGAFYYVVGTSSNESNASSITELAVVTDGTDAYITTGPMVSTKGTDQLTFTATISGSTVTIQASSTSGSSTTVNAYRINMKREESVSAASTVNIGGTQTITGAKTFSSNATFQGSVFTDAIKSAASNQSITIDPEGTGTVDIIGSQTITNTTTQDSLTITTTEDSSTAGPVFTLKRNSSSPADADYLGQIKFKGENDADQEVLYAKISGKILDASDGSEDGIIEFAFRKNGSNNISGRFRSDSLQLLNDTSLRVTGHVELGVLSGDPSTSSNLAQIYAKDDSSSAEVFVQDEAGNVTKISPHNEKGEWEYFSRNKKTGKTVRVNMEEMIKDIEKLTGKKYIKEE